MKYFLGLIGFLFVCFTACKDDFDAPCRDQAVQRTYNLSSEQTLRFPYKSADTVFFVSNTNDTIRYYTNSLSVYQTYKPTTLAGNPECPADVDAYQAESVALIDSITGHQSSAMFLKGNDSAYYTINGTPFSLRILQIGDSTFQYQDSVSLSGKTFYKVTKVFNAAGDSIFVNASNGLIYYTFGGKVYSQFKFNNK